MRPLILGHSFIRRLRDEMLGNDDTFGVDFEEDISILGYSGATVRALRRDHVMNIIMEIQPDVVFLQIGGNDINPSINGRILSESIVEYARILLRLGAGKVIVGSVFSRITPRRISRNLYCKIQTETNTLLNKHKGLGEQIVYWKHRGFPTYADFHKDGIHLNSTGNNKLKFSIREALLTHAI